MFNYQKLLGKIKEKNLSQVELSKTIGMAETTLNLKLNGKSYFKQNEIVKICKVLDIADSEVNGYFFTQKV